MKSRQQLRALGTGVLAIALVLSALETVGVTPAQADGGPVTVITSPPLTAGSTAAPLTVSEGSPVGGTTPIVVDNPGGTSPTAQECIPLQTASESFCLGSSGNEIYPNGTVYPPIKITNAPLPTGAVPPGMDWILTEAYAALADTHGVANDDMVQAYARPEIRAYVVTRLEGIIDKKLYGQPMTPDEESAFDALETYYQAKQVKATTGALAEYNRWTASPCQYDTPAPPAGSGMPVVPNPVLGTAKCGLASSSQLYTITNSTPPATTFETWAAYRNPSNLVSHANDTTVKYMVGKTAAGVVAVGAVGAAAAIGAGVGIGLSAAADVADVLDGADLGEASVTADLSFGAAAAAAGPAIIIAIGLIILAVAIMEIVDDAKPGDTIRDGAASAASNTDPLGVLSAIPAYAGLNYAQRQDPADPALVHTQGFKEGLEGQVEEWMMFDDFGNPVLDPGNGYTVTQSAPDDLHFADGGNVLPNVEVAAPPGALDRTGKPVDGYRVLFSRGWPMVSEHSPTTGVWSPYLPQLTLTYVDQDGNLAQMSLLRHQEGDDPAELDFTETRPSAAAGSQFALSPTWTFTKFGGGLQTVSLLPFDPTLLPVDVVPSAQGILVADNLVTLSPNLSTPGQSLSGTYTWTLVRLDDSGNTVETIALPPGESPSARLLEPGRYRATATFQSNGAPTITRTGTVEFTMAQPAPEVLNATVRDDRVLDGSLFLDLRLLESTRSDTFNVGVDWADDARGNVIHKDYTVQCENSGGAIPTCDTGPMIVPDSAPTNENWSESPTFRIPDDQNYLPQVTVTITNSYGNVTTRSFPIVGDQRPKYATQTPSVTMPAGTFSRQDVVEVFPSALLTDSQDLTIRPFIDQIAAQLPQGVTPGIEERDGHWYLQVSGTPQADAEGTYVFYFPFEQEPEGSGFTPPPALATVEIKAATSPGYRSTLRNTPTAFLDRQYRNVYPDYDVQVAEVLADDSDDFQPFTGTVMCKLTAGPTVVFDKACADDAPFPWPKEKISDVLTASTYLESTTQPLSADGPYSIDLSTKFIDPSITHDQSSNLSEQFSMSLKDLNVILPPFSSSGYTVACSADGGAYAPCLDKGSLTLPRVPGAHGLDVRVTAPDNTSTTTHVTWRVDTPAAKFHLTVPKAHKARGSKLTVKADGLLPKEHYVLRIGGKKVASGSASLKGKVSVGVRVPKGAHLGKVAVTMTGAKADRVGKASLKVVP